jgi:hypothetical protein
MRPAKCALIVLAAFVYGAAPQTAPRTFDTLFRFSRQGNPCTRSGAAA